jgi:hypothetical protein
MKDSEIQSALRRKCYLNRREKALKESAEYYLKHKERIDAYKKEWYKNKKLNKAI